MEIILHRLNEGGTFDNEFLILTQQKSYTVGRKSDNDIILTSKGVSLKHCIFHHNPDGLFIEVLKNQKGLHINGEEKIEGSIIPLNNEDILDIGKTHKYKVHIEPFVPNITDKNQSTSCPEFVEPGFENSIVKSEQLDPHLNETSQKIRIKSESQDPKFFEFVHSDLVDPNLSENKISNMSFEEENVDISLPSSNSIKIEPDESLLNTMHSVELKNTAQAFQLPTGIAINPEESPDLTYQPMEIFSSPQISDLNSAMEISIEEHEIKPLILSLINPETSTSTSTISTLPVQPENQTHLEIAIKQEPDHLNEVISENSVPESDLNQNILQNRIKLENPDIPSTNITLFATPEGRIPELVCNQDFIPQNSELPKREKSPEIHSDQSFLPENSEIPSRARTPDLEEGMKIYVEEPDIKSFLPLLHERMNSGLENESGSEKSELNRPILRIRSDLTLGIKIEPDSVEPSIENQFQTSVDSSIEPSVQDQNHLGVRIKEEKLDSFEIFNETEIEENTPTLIIKEERLDSSNVPIENQIEENTSRVIIKEERFDPPESSEVERSQDSDKNSFGVRIKEEKIDHPEVVQNDLEFEQNILQRPIKTEKPDSNIEDERIKPEPFVGSPQSESFREEPIEREISEPVEYSELVHDEIDIHEEKPGPSLMERLRQFEIYSDSILKKRIKDETQDSLPSAKRIKKECSDSDSDSSDSSNSDSSESRDRKGDEKSEPMNEEESDVRNLTSAQREEYKRYLMISEIIDSNKDSEEVDRLIRELDKRLEREIAKKKNNEGGVETYDINEDEVDIIRDDGKSKRHKKKKDGKRESSKRKSRKSDRKKESRSDKKNKKRKDESESGSRETINSRRNSYREIDLCKETEDSSNRINGDLNKESHRRRSPERRKSPKGNDSSRRKEVSNKSSLKRRDVSRRKESRRETPTRETETNFRSTKSPNGDDSPRDAGKENPPIELSPRSPEPSESSKDSQVQEPENDNRNARSNLMDRDYPGARVLSDYELPEERGRSDPRNRSKYGARVEKKKLDYKEYLKRRAMSKGSNGGSKPTGNEIGIVPISNFRGHYSQSQSERFKIPEDVNSGVPISTFRTQPQSLGQVPPLDPRFIQRGVEHPLSGPSMDPRALGRSQTQPYGIPGGPSTSDPRYQGRSDLHSRSEGPRDPRHIYGGLDNPGVPPSAYDSRYQGRVDLHSSIERPQISRHIFGGLENPVVPAPSTFDPRLQEFRAKGKEDGHQITSVKNPITRVLKLPSTSGKELTLNHLSKLKENINDPSKSEDRVTQKVNQLSVVEPRPSTRTKPLESKDLSDELLATIFSWPPGLFEKNTVKGGTPIASLRNTKKALLSYENLETYCSIAFPLLLLDVSCQIQEVFSFELEKPLLQDCHILPSTMPKIKIQGQNMSLLMFLLKSSVSILDDTVHPSEGDLLRISVLNEYKKHVVMFGYIKQIVSEELSDIPRKIFTYLVYIKEQDFDIHKSTITNIKPITNLKSSVEKAKALHLLKRSPLLPCILRPNPQIDQSVPHELLRQEDLVSKDPLDKKQLTAITKILKSFESEVPNICVVEGSAGTGKTNIIVNTILQLLCTQKPKIQKERLRILVSASTNVEMDQIIIKLKSVLESAKIAKDVVKMVLVGPDEGRRERTKELNLSNFARNHVETDIHKYQETMGLKSMEEQATFLTEQMTMLTKKFEMTKCVHVALQMSLIKMYYDIGRSGRKVKKMTPQEKRELLEVAEKTFLAGANLIFCSIPNLGCSVMENLREKYTVGVCIVDEAAQILEMDTLKVLPFKEKTLVLVGDICKNPTKYDNSPKLRKMGWGCSLFSRIENNFEPNERSPIVRLITQYRISAPIEEWLINSRLFGMNSLRNLVYHKIPFPLHPLRIFNLCFTEDFIDNEAVFASRLIHCIASFGDLRRLERNISVGVIISDIDAKERVEQEIKNRMAEVVPGKALIFNIEVDTVDGFLNHEKDIILASCIRNKHLTNRAGFQRFYSTLTRAKYCLIIYGRFAKVSKCMYPCEWHQLVDYARNVVSVSAYAESTELRRDLIK